MTISLIPLPYAQDALEPHISAKTLEIHHGAHHKTYVDKLNAAIEGTENADKSVEEITKSASGPLFNNAAQTWNHGFYWHSLSPERPRRAKACSPRSTPISVRSTRCSKRFRTKPSITSLRAGHGSSLKLASSRSSRPMTPAPRSPPT